MTHTFAVPSPTRSLLVSIRPKDNSSLLVIGSNRLAASRIFTALEAGYKAYIAYEKSATIDAEIVYRIEHREIEYIELTEDNVCNIITSIKDLEVVCVTDSLVSSNSHARRRPYSSCFEISKVCQSARIHVNIVDQTLLNDISFPATHRWRSSDGQTAHSLQIAVNTFGKGCRLATRIKREILTNLPAEIGRAVDNIATIRSKIISNFDSDLSQIEPVLPSNERDLKSSLDEEDDQLISEPLNTPVTQLGSPLNSAGYFGVAGIPRSETHEESKSRRMKWVAQVSEYWPIKTIGRLTSTDIDRLLADFDSAITPRIPTANPTPVISRSASHTNLAANFSNSTGLLMGSASIAVPNKQSPLRAKTSNDSVLVDFGTPNTLHSLNISRPEPVEMQEPRVLLLGSGPGHPSLLTLAAYNALRSADLVLADKLVPSPVLQLIPQSVETIIAKKFPGNAENAQVELQQLALDFVVQRRAEGRGGTVVRLKQGDPYIYGRGGEEVLFFRSHNIKTIVVPGISSSIAAPLLCNIPVTQRGVSDSLILCTGVGRAGKTSIMPGFRRSRTLIVLMGVARIGELITALTSDTEVLGTRREADRYPDYLPIALIERGSSKDQRMLLSTLGGIEDAINRVGDQRPPGMLVIGWCCLALEGSGNVDVTEPAGLAAGEAGDKERVEKVLGGRGYLVRDGVRDDWMEFLDEMAAVK